MGDSIALNLKVPETLRFPGLFCGQFRISQRPRHYWAHFSPHFRHSSLSFGDFHLRNYPKG